MELLYNNGLVFWTEREIRLRNQFEEHFSYTFGQILLKTNPAWKMFRVDAPILTPKSYVNDNYTNKDIWVQETDDLVLRPETTPSSYVYANQLLTSHKKIKLPFCVWQAGKSFRREQDQVTKNMRLKEFYQQEFQCLYTSDTMNDYHSAILEPVNKMLSEMIHKRTRIVESDRLPNYSEITMDIEANTESFAFASKKDVWMEVCSISRRTDYPYSIKFQTKKGIVEKDILVLEVAIGLDRMVYNFEH